MVSWGTYTFLVIAPEKCKSTLKYVSLFQNLHMSALDNFGVLVATDADRCRGVRLDSHKWTFAAGQTLKTTLRRLVSPPGLLGPCLERDPSWAEVTETP